MGFFKRLFLSLINIYHRAWVLYMLVFLSRLPFISPGYGDDPDAWRVVLSAGFISENLRYVFSRKPGYPFQELVCACLVRLFGQNHTVFNMATVLLSVLAVICFALILKELGCADAILASICLAFTPAVYINSVNSMDYIWALSFVLAGLLFVLRGKEYLAGFFAGMAIGCRVTSVIMVIPLFFLLFFKTGCGIKPALRFIALSLVVGFICFIPVVYAYGFGFLSYFDIVYPPFLMVFTKSTVKVWGALGFLSLVIGFISIFYIPKRFIAMGKPIQTQKIKYQDIILAVVPIVYYGLFLYFPAESGYLIPAVPFIIILCARLFKQPIFRFICAMIIVSSFIGVPVKWFNGETIIDNHAKRLERAKYVGSILTLSQRLDRKSVVACGSWLPQVAVHLKESGGQVWAQYVYSLTKQELDTYITKGYRVYYLPYADGINLITLNTDLKKYGAKPFFKSILNNQQ